MMELTKEIVTAKWKYIIRNRLPTDRGSNDWVWRLVQWAIAEQATENAELKAQIAQMQEDLSRMAEAMNAELGLIEAA